jgi:hypothetical protein
MRGRETKKRRVLIKPGKEREKFVGATLVTHCKGKAVCFSIKKANGGAL